MKATATAGSNIAIVKYWGARDAALNLPANGSISLTLDAARTTTTVRFDPALKSDALVLNGREAGGAALARVSAHLDRLRALAGVRVPALVATANTFPEGAGIASSASGFAALTVAAAAALRLRLSERELSALARLGSGSACRSVIGGWAEWLPGTAHEDSYAVQVAPPEHWDVRDLVVVVSTEAKAVPSAKGHERAASSPLFEARLRQVERALPAVRRAILERDFHALGVLAEADALSMHSVMLTSAPPLLYWLPATVELIRQVWQWRAEGLPCYFTIDAGPNVHILTLPEAVPHVAARLQALPYVRLIIPCGPGSAPRLIPNGA
ncbi:MAG: diphosphomevalonate decarboxylase [Anaerolineales bacterium]